MTSEGIKIPEDMKPNLSLHKLENPSHYCYNLKTHKFKNCLYINNSKIFKIVLEY